MGSLQGHILIRGNSPPSCKTSRSEMGVGGERGSSVSWVRWRRQVGLQVLENTLESFLTGDLPFTLREETNTKEIWVVPLSPTRTCLHTLAAAATLSVLVTSRITVCSLSDIWFLSCLASCSVRHAARPVYPTQIYQHFATFALCLSIHTYTFLQGEKILSLENFESKLQTFNPLHFSNYPLQVVYFPNWSQYRYHILENKQYINNINIQTIFIFSQLS